MEKASYLQNRYRLQNILGQGGMGKVYRGFDIRENKWVAIKQIMITGEVTRSLHERFYREYLFLSIIDHPNIAKAYDFFQDHGNLFIVTELVEGISFAHFIATEAKNLALIDKLAIAIQLSRAIEAVNLLGIIHRDIKPDNILINLQTRNLKILDFGIAKSLYLSKLTCTGAQVGTPHYMSPEQVNGEVHKNSDVFSIAVVLYQFFLNLPYSPFAGHDHLSTFLNVMEKPLPTVIEQLNQTAGEVQQVCYEKLSILLQQALEKDHNIRLESVSHLADKLQQIFNQLNSTLEQTTFDIAIAAKTTLWQPTQTLRPDQVDNIKKLVVQYHRPSDLLGPQSSKKRKKYVFTLIAILTLVLPVILLFLWPNQQSLNRDFVSQQKNKDEMYSLGLIYQKGSEVKQDYAQALYWYHKAAEQGHSTAMINIGLIYQNGWGVTQDYTQAIYWYDKAIEKDDSSAMVYMGLLYKNGLGVKKDYIQAIYWIRKAVEKKHIAAMRCLGDMYQNGWGVEKDCTQALYWYRKSAEKGYYIAMYNVGLMHQNGLGTEQDYTQAIYWFCKAAEKGHSSSAYELGRIYQNGLGVELDYAQAIYWYHKAAEKGHSSAMVNIGLIYQNGWGVAQDYAQAIQWFRKAIEKNDPSAMIFLGLVYKNGLGIEQDYIQAIYWFHKAAEKDHSSAMCELGTLYKNGLGIEKDHNQALFWLKKAATAGNQQAKGILKQMLE